jgi:hypothetical protein
MDVSDLGMRLFSNLAARPEGVLALRFLLQPAVSSILGILDGIKDGRTDRTPYLWTILSEPGKRRGRLSEGVSATAKVLGMALATDLVYQHVSLDTFYLGEAIVVAFALGFVPYLLIRGPAARVTRWWMRLKAKG